MEKTKKEELEQKLLASFDAVKDGFKHRQYVGLNWQMQEDIFDLLYTAFQAIRPIPENFLPGASEVRARLWFEKHYKEYDQNSLRVGKGFYGVEGCGRCKGRGYLGGVNCPSCNPPCYD